MIKIQHGPEVTETVDRVQQVMDANSGKAKRRRNGDAKKLLTIRIDPEVIDWFKSGGEGWQVRMNDALRKAAGL